MKTIVMLLALIFAPAFVPALNVQREMIHAETHKEPAQGKPKRKIWGWICIGASVVLFFALRLILQKLLILALIGLLITGVVLLII